MIKILNSLKLVCEMNNRRKISLTKSIYHSYFLSSINFIMNSLHISNNLEDFMPLVMLKFYSSRDDKSRLKKKLAQNIKGAIKAIF